MKVGKMTYSMKYQSLSEAIRTIQSELETILQEKNLSFDIKILTDDDCFLFDYFRISQVIRNLLFNAIKFSPEHKSINVIVEDDRIEEGDTVIPAIKTSVVDQGVGIPKDEEEIIFEKYSQSSQTESDSGGTGLGLAIVYEIVTAHKGLVRAYNAEKEGAIFQFTLPKM